LSEIDTANSGKGTLPFQRPADYYSTPVLDQRRLFPRWVPIGCGAASIVLILALFVTGALVSSGKFGGFFELVFGQLQTEVQGQFTKDVTAQQKAAFNAEMKTMLDSLRDGKLPPDRLQPLMKAIRDVSADNKIDRGEADKLVAAVRQVNRKK
jgi:hypothetical protein